MKEETQGFKPVKFARISATLSRKVLVVCMRSGNMCRNHRGLALLFVVILVIKPFAGRGCSIAVTRNLRGLETEES